jgi:DNA-binding transcriptional MerR regulator
MNTFSQITMAFVEDEKRSPEAAAPAPADQPVNIGIRIKKLKETAEPMATPAARSGRGRKSIKQISEEADLINVPEDEVLFQKHYYTMGEVSEMFRVNQSLLRFWETEFSILQPKKNKKGDRYFRPVDIKNLHLIYHLLRQRKYTIEGAKDFLKKNKRAEEKFETIRKLEQLKGFLLELKATL